MGEGTAGDKDGVEVSFSPGLAQFLARHDLSIAFTSYQSGRLYLLGHSPDGKLALHEALWPQAMGVAGNADRLYLGTLTELVRLENVLDSGQLANGKHDRVYVPRNLQTFGDIDFHELGVRADGVVTVVNTRYSCLCVPSLRHSFRPIWKPSFVSALVPEDRCHLNGLAMRDGVPRYVTVVAATDSERRWREHRTDGGVVIDVTDDSTVCAGLSMPHSPRWHDGNLWLLNSGTGEIGRVAHGEFNPLICAPGFLRGLAFHDNFMAVGLSKPRDGRFEGLELDGRLAASGEEAWCGIQIRSLDDGSLLEWLRLEGAIIELFGLCVLPGVRDAITVGPRTAEIRDLITIES
jgi:uncharacterized protein (TIGR03032 family)